MSTLDVLIQAVGYVTLLSLAIDALVLVYKFVRRVRQKLGEPICGIESKKLLHFWTFTILLVLVVPCYIAAGIILFLTMNFQVFLEVLVLLTIFVVSVGLTPWTVPAFVEIVHEYVKKHWG